MTDQAATVEGQSRHPNTGLNIALWIVQILLAFVFFMSGAMKTTQPISALAAHGMNWASKVPSLVRFIGVSELAGAIGLLLPALTRIKPVLTPLAAIGLLVIMVLAVPFHLSRGEVNHVFLPVILGAFAAFVAWGRFRAAPIRPRGG